MSTISGAAQTNTAVNNDMGKDAFMKMLIAQLKNQDPLNPMDGTEFAVQLAQFTSLEKLTNLNETMKVLPEYLGSFANAQMVNMIGNEAVANGNVIDVNSTSAKITYSLPSAVASATISIYNPSGLQVDTVKVGAQSAGLNSMTWNCGNIESGSYTYDIKALDKDGREVKVDKMLTGTVTGASFKNGGAYLTINGQEVAFANVIAINKPNN
ncbi:MAG: flagellar hook assembly protein FlgD [Smithellaceae bacterium]